MHLKYVIAGLIAAAIAIVVGIGVVYPACTFGWHEVRDESCGITLRMPGAPESHREKLPVTVSADQHRALDLHVYFFSERGWRQAVTGRLFGVYCVPCGDQADRTLATNIIEQKIGDDFGGRASHRRAISSGAYREINYELEEKYISFRVRIVESPRSVCGLVVDRQHVLPRTDTAFLASLRAIR